MRSNLKRVYEFPTSLDQRIEIVEREIDRQTALIANLTRYGHGTTVANTRMVYLLTTINDLLQTKIEAS